MIGEYQHNIDSKGRVIVPVKFREDLGECFYVTKGRFFFSGATDVETDKQGRILIPQPLRDHAGLTKDVTFVGVSSRVEIWDTSRWNQVNGELTEESIAEAMDELGI